MTALSTEPVWSSSFGPWHTDTAKCVRPDAAEMHTHVWQQRIHACGIHVSACLACQRWCQVHSPHRSSQKSASIRSVLARFSRKGPRQDSPPFPSGNTVHPLEKNPLLSVRSVRRRRRHWWWQTPSAHHITEWGRRVSRRRRRRMLRLDPTPTTGWMRAWSFEWREALQSQSTAHGKHGGVAMTGHPRGTKKQQWDLLNISIHSPRQHWDWIKSNYSLLLLRLFFWRDAVISGFLLCSDMHRFENLHWKAKFFNTNSNIYHLNNKWDPINTSVSIDTNEFE